MLEQIIKLDQKLFLYLNSKHTEVLDNLMSFLSNNFIFLFLTLSLCLFSIFKKYNLKRSIFSFLVIILCFASSDIISTKFFKNTIKRPRPCYTENIKPKVHSVGSCYGGRYGFVSSHASNTMALAVIIFLLTCGFKKIIALLFPYSILVAYSRIYVGKHYPLDVICGMILGLLIGFIVFLAFSKISLKQLEDQL